MAHYLVEMDIWWGSGHCDTYRTSVNKISELDQWAKGTLIKVARRYTFDCGELGRPLNPSIGNIRITKAQPTRTIIREKLQRFLNNEKTWTKKLILKGEQFTSNHTYNYDPAPLNKRSVK